MITRETNTALRCAGDVGDLYGLLAERLEQIVRVGVRAPDVVIEDACQMAWTRLVHHRDRVQRDTVMSWLARTAMNEALRLVRRDRRELSLESEAVPPIPAIRAAAGPDAVVEQRQRLREIRVLPERQQRVLWLHALGLSYTEIAAHEACTVRTVERQMMRAREGVKELARAA